MQFIFLMEGFICAWACTRAFGLNSISIMGCLLFIMTSVFIFYVKNNCKTVFIKKNCIILSILSFVLTVLYTISEYKTILGELTSSLFKLIILVITFVGLYLLLFYTESFLLWLCTQKKKIKTAECKYPKLYRFFPLVAFITAFILWLPWFLYSYPGIMTPDSINQVEQIVGLVPASNHHPIVHTLTIGIFYKLGVAVFGTANAGVASYILFQMLFLSSSVAFLIKTIQDFQPEKTLKLPVMVLCFYTLIPYNAVMSVTVWKDSFFAGVALFFSTLLFRILANENNRLHSYLLFFLSALAFCLFRTNGFYAFVMLTPFLIFIFWKKSKSAAFGNIVIIALVLLIKGPVMSHYNISQPDFVESLCIPVQEVARVLVDDREIAEEELEMIEQVIDTTYIHELYAADFADNIKELVRAGNQDYLSDNRKDYAKLYLQMMFEYPDEYFYAYTDQTYGYYNPNASYTVADVEGIIQNDIGLYSDPVISSHFLLKIREILIKLQNIVPVYGTLWSMGCMLWYALTLLAISISRSPQKSSVHWVPFIPAIAVIATLLLATPVATEFRYAYALFYSMPLLTFISLFYGKEKEAV